MRSLWLALSTLLWLLLLPACGTFHPPGQASKAGAGKEAAGTYHTVRAGDTLYAIAWRHGRDYRQVARWNNISPPYRIYPGQRLLVVPAGAATVSTRSVPGSDSGSVSGKAPARQAVPATGKLAKTAPRPHSSVQWQWPATGSLKHRFTDADSKKGISISGRSGQSVLAAAAGEVVYSGSGLVGYGNLLILKHDDTFFSAYGHNRKLLVAEGQQVRRGQQVAEMGETTRDGPVLHFEIRRDGRPVDPLQYLPAR